MLPLQSVTGYPGEVALATWIQRFHRVTPALHPALPAWVSQVPAARKRGPPGLRERYNKSQPFFFLIAGVITTLICSLDIPSALRRLWGDKDYSVEVEEMLEEKAALQSVRSHSVMELIKNQTLRWQLLTIFVTFTTLQLCGINAVSIVPQTQHSFAQGVVKC